MKQFTILLILAIALGLWSCNNDNSESNSFINNPPIAYTANPFEYVGEDHNTATEYYVSAIAEDSATFSSYYTNRNTFNSEIANYLFDAYHETNVNDTITLNECISQVESLNVFAGDSADNFFDVMFYDRFSDHIDVNVLPYVSKNDSIWIDEIRDLVYDFCYDNLNDPDINFPNKDANSFLTQITSLETQMLHVDWDVNDKDALIMLALLKHSANFWHDEINPDGNIIEVIKKNKLLGLSPEVKAKIKEYAMWKYLLISDISGMLQGTLTAYGVWKLLDEAGVIDEWIDNM